METIFSLKEKEGEDLILDMIEDCLYSYQSVYTPLWIRDKRYVIVDIRDEIKDKLRRIITVVPYSLENQRHKV